MRNVVVTGGSRGLGLAIARRLAEGGDRVIAIARTQGEQLAAAIRQAEQAGRGEIHFRPFDLGSVEEIQGLVTALRGRFGTMYGLVNNAAVGTPGILATMPDAEIGRLVRLNVLSPITLTKHVVRSMMAGGAGRVVNVSSIVGSTGYSGISVYSATKASLAGFTRSLAREVGPVGITVNAVAPGFLETEMTGGTGDAHLEQIRRRSALRRLAEVGDVADAVAYLMSESARNITGATITIDAGGTA